MILEICYQSNIDFKAVFDNITYTIPRGDNSYKIEYHPRYDHGMFLDIYCEDQHVYNSPIFINKLVIDDFWTLSSSRIKKFGSNIYDKQYVEFAKLNNRLLDYDVNDNDCLFFTGALRFKIVHPIYRMMHDA